MRSDPLEIPASLASRYRVERFLGEGSAGRVLLAEDRELARMVAIKLLSGKSQLASRERFLDEARTLAGLRHPNVLQIYDFGAEGDLAWLVVEHAPGGTLEEAAGKRGMPFEASTSAAARILDALEYIHGCSVLHRDVKPANVLLARDGSLRLADFGLAKGPRPSGLRTVTGVVLGTVEFLAPELFEGKPASPASDLYSWGATYFALLYGRPPREGAVGEILAASRAGALPREAAAGPAARVLSRALETDPARRAGAAELRRVLGDVGKTAPDEPTVAAERASGAGKPRQAAAGGAEIRTLAPTVAAGRTPGAERSRSLLAGLAAATALGLAAVALVPDRGGTASSAPETASPGGSSALDLLRTWRARLRDHPPAELVAAIQARVLSDQPADRRVHYQAAMAASRFGTGPDPRTLRLRAEVEGLPLRAELDRDRPDLEHALADASEPFARRRDLFEVLQQFEAVDVYFAAFGSPRPYLLRELLERFVPIRVIHEFPPAKDDASTDTLFDFPRPKLAEKPPGVGSPLAPGVWLLYHWALDPLRRVSLLIQHPDDLSPVQSSTINTALGLSWTPTESIDVYGGAEAEVTLGEVAPSPFRRAALRIEFGNLIPPDGLKLAWNGLLIDLRLPMRLARRKSYYPTKGPEARMEVELPLGSLVAGTNTLRIREVELPGLPHYVGCDLESVHLVLEAR